METTTKAKHTPGPWRFDTYRDSGRPNPGLIVADNPHGEGAEEVASITWIAGGFFAEQVANARLIAAAPELLEILETIVEDAGYGGGGAKL